MLEHSCNTEIADFNRTALRHEDVLSLEVTVEDLAVVDVLDCQGHLHKPV